MCAYRVLIVCQVEVTELLGVVWLVCVDCCARSTCVARQKANHNVGPSYPQGLTVVDPAPKSVQGFYVVATNNKEDVVVTKVKFSDL